MRTGDGQSLTVTSPHRLPLARWVKAPLRPTGADRDASDRPAHERRVAIRQTLSLNRY